MKIPSEFQRTSRHPNHLLLPYALALDVQIAAPTANECLMYDKAISMIEKALGRNLRSRS